MISHSLLDLVPAAVVEKWLKHLRNEFPTIAFKASTQTQKQHLVCLLISFPKYGKLVSPRFTTLYYNQCNLLWNTRVICYIPDHLTYFNLTIWFSPRSSVSFGKSASKKNVYIKLWNLLKLIYCLKGSKWNFFLFVCIAILIWHFGLNGCL